LQMTFKFIIYINVKRQLVKKLIWY